MRLLFIIRFVDVGKKLTNRFVNYFSRKSGVNNFDSGVFLKVKFKKLFSRDFGGNKKISLQKFFNKFKKKYFPPFYETCKKIKFKFF